MKTLLKIFGTIFLLLLLTLTTMPGVHAVSSQSSGSGDQAISFQAAEPGAKVSALLWLQVDAKLRCQQVPPTAGELSMMQARGMRTEDLGMQRIFIHLAQEPTAEQIDELEAMGITPYPDSWIPPVGEFPTGFIVVDMPIDKLDELVDKDYVVQLDTAEQLLEPQNDLAAIKINADDVWNSGYDGTDVRIAVIDSGLDTAHPDIPAPVASKDYSNWPVLDDTIANSVTGHGTHVAGSALGRGTQSSGATHEYTGMAPDADLIFLKIGNDTTSNASLDAMTNAIKAAVDTYYADIITMSYGGWGYYHDGTRQTCQAVDYAFSQGAVVFISAGNEGNDGEHYSGTVNAYSSTGFIQVDVSGSTGVNAGLGFNLVWYDGLANSNDLVLEYYDSTQTAMADIWTSAQEESWKGTEHELSGYGPEAGWYYYLPAGSPTYYLKVTNNSDSQQFFHIYYENLTSGGASVEFQNPDPFYTLSSPADAEKAIAVGAYTTRQNWTNYEGDAYTYNETLNTMAGFSSRGPRVDSGAPQKPNIVAPGSAIISVRDTDVYTWPGGYDSRVIDNDGLNLNGSGPADYFVMQGTSMACPIAAGATALLLEAQPALKGHPADVRNLLQSTATSVNANDNIDGYGLLDIQAAIDATASELEVDWLFMVYLDADNNLESAGIDDLNEMEVAGSTDQVKIVVEMDRAERDYDDDTTNGNWTGAKRFYVTQDADQAIINSPVISDLGEVNMGDPATLQSFIEWAIANYPAQHYALVLWNHGSGWRERNATSAVKSICVDDQANDELTMTEVRSALNAANATTGVKLDIIGFDACLMQMVEVAYQVMGSASRPLVDIAVGSEETEPGDGWDYAATLTALTASPTMTPSALATQIVNDYVSSYSSTWDITQSAANLGLVDELATAIDSFAQAMTSATGDWNAIKTARGQAQEYYYEYYIDLYHFAQLVNQNTSISQAVRDAASAVMTAVSNAVIAEGHTASVGNSHGLSIYYPETSAYYFSYYETEVLFTADTQWDEFLYAILFTSPTEPDITVSPTSFDVTLAPNTTQDYTLTIGNDGGADLTYDISDQETTDGQAQTIIESTPIEAPGIDAYGNEVLDKSPSQMVVPQSVGEVITSFAAPGSGPLGLAWDGEYLWNADWETNMIYKLSPSTGSVVQSFSAPGTRPFGLTYDGTYLWVADRNIDLICQLDPATGSVVKSIPTPGVEPGGLTWDGEYLWVAEHYDNTIYKLAPSDGSIIQSFSWTGTYVGGLAWDGTYLWHCDSDFNTIYKLNPTDGSVITSFSSPADWPAGLTWDGTYLWNTDSEQDRIYKIDVGAEQDCSWLDENPISGTVAAGGSDSVTVTIDTTGLAESNYSAEIVIASNDPDEASTTVPVTLQVGATDPDITVSPTSFDVTLAPDTTQDYTLTIGNDGGADLTYDITDQETTLSVAPEAQVGIPTPEAVEAIGKSSEERTGVVPVTPSYDPRTPAEVALFKDSDPWYYTAIEDILTANGTTYDVYNSSQMGIVDLSPYEKVITASVQGDTFWNALEANKTWFESYVNDGGVLEMHLCAYSGSNSPGKVYPGGFVFYHTDIELISIVDSTHLVVNTPNTITDAQLDDWSYSAHGWFDAIPAAGDVVLKSTTNDEPVFVETVFGSGYIFTTTQSVEWRAGGGYPEFLENMTVYTPETDCSWLSESPISGTVAAGGSDSITVTIDTTGLAEGSYSAEIVIASNDPDEASTTVPVTLQVGVTDPDITVSPTSFDVTLAPDTTQDYTLTIGNDGGTDLTYEISDQETTSGQAQTAIESSLATAKEEMGSRSPDLVLTNSVYDMGIAVEDMAQYDGIGRYTEATADEKLLLYGYPDAWSSYMTVQLDGSDYYQDTTTMDSYVTQAPAVDGNSITTQWSLPTDVGVSERLTLQQDTTKYHVTVTNNDATSHEVKIRFLLDTMLAYNDGAPFIVPGVGNVTTEQEYTNPVFDYWQATDDLVTPTLTSNCTFDTSNKPYKVQFAYWPSIYNVTFDYTATIGQDITWDTAVGMYWNLGTLSPGEAKDVIFYYGTTDAIIGTPEVSIVTLFTDKDSYLPEEDVTIYVDVGNGGDAALVNGIVTVNVQNPEGVSVFEDSSTITVEAGVVASWNFTYTLSADAVVGQYVVTAKVYDSGETLLDEATATFTVSSADCSWLDENPKSGTVAAGGSDSITVTIDTTGLAEGSYSAEIIIASNDPDEASTTVPVTLQVSPAELPTVTSVSPNSGEQGATLEVTIGGTNLTGATAVSFGDGITVNSFTVVSATQITASISISTTATLGLRDVSVTTPDGTGTLTDGFTVVVTGLVTVSIDAPDEAAPDSDFTADVNISEVTDFDACNYDVTFDASVLRLDNVTSGLIGSTTIPVDVYNEISSGTWRIVQNVPGMAGISGSGYLAVLHFHVIGSEGDSSAISLTNGVLSNNLAEEIVATWVGDSIDITSVVPGDANGDGVVNALDITKVERIIVGLDAETPGADANQDGSVNALDITKVERIIVGLD